MASKPQVGLVERQAVYWSTGACAGLASQLAVSLSHRSFPKVFPSTPINASTVRHATAGAGMRFLAFDLCRDAIQEPTKDFPSFRGAVSGCVGGLAETLQGAIVATLSTRSLKPLKPAVLAPSLLSHGSTLFLCFGSYTFFSTSLSKSQPPVAPLCFFLGGLAGAFGVPAFHAFRRQSLSGCKNLAATGFVRVGMVIGCQVVSSAMILDLLEGRRLQQYEGT